MAITINNTPDEKVILKLNGQHALSGSFVARKADVDAKLRINTKRQLRRLCLDYWPELFKTAEARAELNAQPSYVLAVVTSQL